MAMSENKADPIHMHEKILFSERLIDPNGWTGKAEELLAAAALLEID